MKEIVHREYGPPDVLILEEVPKLTPSGDEVLLEAQAASVKYANPALVRSKPFPVRLMIGGPLQPKYKIPGGDIAGRVEAIGRNVEQVQPDNEVHGDLSSCAFGGFTEYLCVRENLLALKPANMTFEEAATVPCGGFTALGFLRKGNIQSGQEVLIYGVSGSVGTYTVQIAG